MWMVVLDGAVHDVAISSSIARQQTLGISREKEKGR